MPKYSKAERADALAFFRKHVSPGDTLHCILRNVSRSGMQREIGLVLILADGVTLHPNHSGAVLTGYRTGKRDGIIVGGCGMDMGFHLVYSVSRTLFPDGFGVLSQPLESGERVRPASREEAARMVSEGVIFRGRNQDITGWDDDGGYALKHRWL